MRCIQKLVSGEDCNEEAMAGSEYCPIHDPEKPYIRYLQPFHNRRRGDIRRLSKRDAAFAVSTGIAEYLEPLNRDEWVKLMEKSMQTLINRAKELCIRCIRAGNNESLLDFFNDKDTPAGIEFIRSLGFSLSDLLYLALILDIPKDKLIDMRLSDTGNPKKRE